MCTGGAVDYRITRVSLTEALLRDSSGHEPGRISWPAARIWGAKNAPLSEALGPRFLESPVLEVDGKKFEAKRTLLSNNWVVNDFDVSLEGVEGGLVAHLREDRRRIEIFYRGEKSTLLRKGYFRFRYEVECPGGGRLRMKDTTPFFTFTSRREFLINGDGYTDPLFVLFAFFLAHNMHF